MMISLTELLLLTISVLFGFYYWSKYNLSYWRRKNVAFIEPNIFFGNLRDILKKSKCAAENLQDLYNHPNARDQPFLGIYILNKPALLIREPELIKSILVKNFNKFSNRFAASDKRDTLGSNSLFFLKNPYWKQLHSKFTPVFSSGKVKQMFPLIKDVGIDLNNHLYSFEIDEDKSFIQEVKEISALYTTDVIASVAFGVQANCLRNPEAEFRQNVRIIFQFTLLRALQFVTVFFMPHLAKFSGLKIFPKEAAKFFRGAFHYVMDERIKNGNTRNDFIDVLVAFKEAADVENDCNGLVMTDDILIAQASFFFSAGHEPSAKTMAFCLYELSKNPKIQIRLREEIKAVLLASNTLTYEAVNKMEYLDMIIMEVLRLYPTLPFLTRECTLPSDEKEFSLQPESDFAIPNNMGVFIPSFAIQRDPKYFPNPEHFDPERFSAHNKMNIQPYTFMSFGLGPHKCIGERLGLLQVKIGIINVLKNHYVTICDKSHKKMIFNPKAMVLQSKGGLYCKFVRDPLV